MSKIFKVTDLVKVVTEGETPPNCDLTLQLRPTYAKDGVAKGVWEVDEKFINGNGVSMGGFIAAAADTMFAYVMASILKDDQTFTTIDLHTTFHRPVTKGEVYIEARAERVGRRVAYLVADLMQNDKKVATAVSNMMIL